MSNFICVFLRIGDPFWRFGRNPQGNQSPGGIDPNLLEAPIWFVRGVIVASFGTMSDVPSTRAQKGRALQVACGQQKDKFLSLTALQGTSLVGNQVNQ